MAIYIYDAKVMLFFILRNNYAVFLKSVAYNQHN